MLLQYQSFSMTWNPEPLCMSIQNRFGCIRMVKIRFTTRTSCLSGIPSGVSCEAVGSTAGIKGSAGVSGMAAAIQTQSGSSVSHR